MIVGSLFAGIGGFDLAAERAGMTVAWQSENDRHASQVLAHRFPKVPNYGDIHGIESPPAVDVLTGGFPCQDYSVAGLRGGLAGDRGALWWEYHRLITDLKPTWIVGENVPGLISSRGGKDFETIITSLTECGYGVAWAVLDAQYFGVAQRRRRVFIIGHSGGQPRPEILALSEGMFGHPAPSRETKSEPTESSPNRAREGITTTDIDNEPVAAFNWQSGGDVRLGVREEHTDALQASQVPAVFLAPTTIRRFTPLECERLQGFPDHWTGTPGNSNTQRYRQLGNAVAVPVAEWLMQKIAAA